MSVDVEVRTAPAPAPAQVAGEPALALGAAAALSLLLTATLAVASDLAYGPFDGRAPVLVLVAVAAALVLAVVARGIHLGYRRPEQLLGAVVAGFGRQRGVVRAAALGAVVALPWLLLLRATFSDADSARLLSAIAHVGDEGPAYLADTQEVLLPFVVLGPLAALGGNPAVSVWAVGSLVALVALVSAMAATAGRSMAGGVAAALALLSMYELTFRATTAPMYPAMLGLGYGGAWLALRALRAEGRRQWALGAAAAACLLLSWEAHAVGQLFLASPVLLLVLRRPTRSDLVGLARLYSVMAVLALPRIVVNLWEGGFSRFRSNRTDYIVTEGYIHLINRDFWDLPVSGEVGDWVRNLPDVLGRAMSGPGLLAAAVGLAAVVLQRGPVRRLGLAALGAFLVALLVASPAPYPRYLLPIVPGAAVAAGTGVAALLRAQRPSPVRLAGALALAGLAATALVNHERVVDDVQFQERNVAISGLHAVAAELGDGRGVLGVRASRLTWVEADAPVWSGQFLTEEEYVTFLTWPSDDAVLELLERHDIGWIVVSPDIALELDYDQTWVGPVYGGRVRHLEAVAASPAFCRVDQLSRYLLYRLGPCDGPAAPAPAPGPVPVPP